MLDIIIPTYKNKEGLRQTLSSIDRSYLNEITISIVDDASEIYYNDIFEQFPFITIYYKYPNSGPGVAREYGIHTTIEPYIMFIDTGDTLIDSKILPTIINTIKQNPEIVVFSWQYKIGEKTSTNNNNRLHGRVYKREFLEKYGIEFCATGSYTNEDVGFNRLCRIIIDDKQLKSMNFKNPIINYIKDENSITNKNKGEFFFRQQNKGLALNSIHTIKIAEKNNVSLSIILNEVNSIMSSMYYTFLCTAYERPEFVQEAWEGARLFYNQCFIPYIEKNSNEKIATAYNLFVKRIYLRAKAHSWKNFKPLNYTRFLKNLKEYETVPSWYNA